MDKFSNITKSDCEIYEDTKKMIHDIRTPLVTIKTGIQYTISMLNIKKQNGNTDSDLFKIINLLNNALRAGETISNSLDSVSNRIYEKENQQNE